MNNLALIFSLTVAGAGAGAVIVSTPPPPLSDAWETKQISRHFWAEGACVADVDKDGENDILSGPFWFAGPDFKKKTTIYSAKNSFVTKTGDGEEKKIAGFEGALGTKNTYSDNFLSYSYDFNADGWQDYFVVGFPGKESFWYQNPGEGKVPENGWQRHVALAITDNESPILGDFDGDDVPELLAMSDGTVGFASWDTKNPTAPWKWNAVSPVDKKKYQRFTHGIGHGDINGDGRNDILEAGGWWEQPADWDGTTPWVRHDVAFGSRGAQMFGIDVNGDGRTDVITALDAHGYGLAWFEQLDGGKWKRHLLIDTPDEKGETGVSFTQPHAVEVADINGDGLMDIVTGKRFWAHGPKGDAEPDAAPVLYVFEQKRKDGQATFEAKIVHDNSGVGTQVMAVDVNGDKKKDILVGNKRGCFLHLQR